jgi:hypothetical protein
MKVLDVVLSFRKRKGKNKAPQQILKNHRFMAFEKNF